MCSPLFVCALDYTVVIHIGQMVDLEVVVEALEKGRKGRRDSTILSPSLESLPSLTRDQTLQRLPVSERLRFRLANTLLGPRGESFVVWLVVLDLLLIASTFVPQVDRVAGTGIRVVCAVIAALFLLELALKLYAVDFRLRGRRLWLAVDGAVVVLNAAAAVVALVLSDASYEMVVLLRLVNVLRVAHTNKVYLAEVEREMEHRAAMPAVAEDEEFQEMEHLVEQESH